MNFKWLEALAPEIEPSQFPEFQHIEAARAWQDFALLIDAKEEAVLRRVSDYFQLPVADDKPPNPLALKLVPKSLAERFLILPVDCSDQEITILTANPGDSDAIQALQFNSARVVSLIVAHPLDIERLIALHYRDTAVPNGHFKSSHQTGSLMLKGRTISSRLDQNTAPTEKLFLLILKEALNRKVSDIHIQPFVGGAAVRFRIDGVMHQIKSMPIAVMQQLIRHIKALADLDVTNNRTPQDGRLTLVIDEEQRRDLRISLLPAEGGERLVIRILANQNSAETLNFPKELDHAISRAMLDTSGVILATGPTGSGKTTTLYSMLQKLNHDTTNILSVEDPVEIKMTGVSQTSVNNAQGLTFPAVLRSMLRQDPDVILVGEIRDSETADLAMRAALTGHLVLSTMHTIDAVSSVTRLIDLGVSQVLIADAVRFIINQRLVRHLCSNCKCPASESSATENERLFMNITPGEGAVYQAAGCEACNQTGYSGRLPIAQVWELSEQSRRLLRSAQLDESALFDDAVSSGMTSLHDSGVALIKQGQTSVDEVARVSGNSFWRSLGDIALAERNQSASQTFSTMTEKLLLVIENETLRDSMVSSLEALGLIVTAVDDFQRAKRHIESGAPVDLMLIDVEHGSDTPMTAFSKLDAALSYSGLSAVLLIPEDADALETLLDVFNASDWIRKPATLDEITRKVQAVLRRRHL